MKSLSRPDPYLELSRSKRMFFMKNPLAKLLLLLLLPKCLIVSAASSAATLLRLLVFCKTSIWSNWYFVSPVFSGILQCTLWTPLHSSYQYLLRHKISTCAFCAFVLQLIHQYILVLAVLAVLCLTEECALQSVLQSVVPYRGVIIACHPARPASRQPNIDLPHI